MKLFKALLVCVLVLSGARCSYAGSAGAEPFDFLFLDANARSVGMGGAYTALATDANALLYNPAGLGMVKRHEATFMHNSYFEGSAQEYVGVSMKQGLGFNLNYLNYGSITRTTYSNPNGLGTFGITDMALAGGYGRKLTGIIDDLSVGAGLKYISETIDATSARTVALDLGGLFTPSSLPGFSAGLAIQNLGPNVKFQSATQNLPYNFRTGAAYTFDYMNLGNTVALDINKERTQNAVVGFGAETVIGKIGAVRIGYNSRNNAGPGITAGLGLIQTNYSVDYAIVPFGDLGLTHRISVSYRWGDRK